MALRSRSNCVTCSKETEGLPFCETCGKLKALPEGLSHFDVLGIPEELILDEEPLRKRFYELSRKTHPDMFATVPPPLSTYAMQWSAAINRAYQALKDPLKRSHYVLELHQIPEKKNEIPLDLAETYFELQDADEAQLPKFRDELLKEEDADLSEWEEIAKSKDLNRLRTYLTKQRYLNSMLSDLEKRLGIQSDRGH